LPGWGEGKHYGFKLETESRSYFVRIAYLSCQTDSLIYLIFRRRIRLPDGAFLFHHRGVVFLLRMTDQNLPVANNNHSLYTLNLVHIWDKRVEGK